MNSRILKGKRQILIGEWRPQCRYMFNIAKNLQKNICPETSGIIPRVTSKKFLKMHLPQQPSLQRGKMYTHAFGFLLAAILLRNGIFSEKNALKKIIFSIKLFKTSVFGIFFCTRIWHYIDRESKRQRWAQFS